MNRVILIVVCVSSLLQTTTSRLARPCYYALVREAEVTNVTVRDRAEVIKSGNITNLVVMVNVTWDVYVPDGLQLDGFIVHMHLVGQGTDEPTILPTNVCNPGRDHYWATTSDDTALCTKNTTSCQVVSGSSSPDQKICLYNYTTETQPGCRGSANFYIRNLGYLSVRPEIRSLEFETDFHITYDIHIYPYYREFVGAQLRSNYIESTNDCPTALMNGTGLSLQTATELCCQKGVRHTIPRFLGFGNPVVDFETDSVNLTATWLPPISNTNLTGFSIYVTRHSPPTRATFIEPYNTPEVSISLGPDELSSRASCDDTTEKYESVLYRLYPGVLYWLHITPRYMEPQATDYQCGSGECNTYVPFVVPDTNACHANHSYCDDLATECIPEDATGMITFNSTCICQAGYDGNGRLRNVYATGCDDADYCIPTRTPCVTTAICDDLPAPLLNANCTCISGYYGDGRVGGSGCTHRATVALAVAIPLFVVCSIIVALIAWKIVRRRAQLLEFKWSEFVANDALRTYMFTNDYENSELCIPTFGDKWEIDRTRVSLGKVLGRGNYGIVYQGAYEAIDEEQQLNEVPVAVKTMKEGAEEDKHVADFLAEIGFMLNVGDHANVLKVIGCCTTQKPILLITDFLKYGDLLHFLWDAREPSICEIDPVYHVTEKSLYQMSRQVAQGMDYLTKSRIIHGDLAARNILVGEDLVCKISDFGLANDVYRYGVIQGQSERCVPFKWISPERMMAGKVPITSKSDVWSFGNLMYEMVTLGCMPHPDVESGDLLDQLKSGYRMKQPSTCSNEMFSIMSKCWKWRPSSRPSFTDLVALLDGALDTNVDNDYVNLADAVQKLDKSEYENVVGTKKEDVTGEEKHANDDLVIDTSLPDKPTNGDLLNGHLNNGFQCEA